MRIDEKTSLLFPGKKFRTSFYIKIFTVLVIFSGYMET